MNIFWGGGGDNFCLWAFSLGKLMDKKNFVTNNNPISGNIITTCTTKRMINMDVASATKSDRHHVTFIIG